MIIWADSTHRIDGSDMFTYMKTIKHDPSCRYIHVPVPWILWGIWGMILSHYISIYIYIGTAFISHERRILAQSNRIPWNVMRVLNVVHPFLLDQLK